MGTARWERWRRSALDAIRALSKEDFNREMILSGLTAAYERAGEPEHSRLTRTSSSPSPTTTAVAATTTPMTFGAASALTALP